MKINKKNPRHWLCLILFGLNVLGAMLARPWHRRGPHKTVVLYGHKLCGNLRAIHRYWQAHAIADMDMVFLTMDKAYHRKLQAEGVASVLATRPGAMSLLARADAIISDHGLHSMSIMVGRSSIQFFDVWHGIMFKGFAPEDFRLQHRYMETWVASPLLKKMYVEQFGFSPERTIVTGYARTDALVRVTPDPAAARRRFDLPVEGPILLFAPTWQRSSTGSIYPFGVPEHEFLSRLSDVAERTGATVVMRSHLNTHGQGQGGTTHIVQRPFADWPDSEGLLLACDVLVCDWSSMAFDWLLLNRPTLFLDIPIPTPRGFALGPEYRFGEVVSSLDGLLASVGQAVSETEKYLARFAAHRADVLDEVYGACADGQSSARCVERLRDHLFSAESSR